MPSTSKKQARLMAAAAHNPAFAKKVGIPVSVAKEFNQADKGKKFGSGGMAKMKHDDLAEDKKLIKKAFGMHDKQEHPGKKTDLSKLKGGGMARMGSKGEHPVQKQSKRGAEMIKMCKGGSTAKRYNGEDGSEVELETKQGRNEGASIDDDVRSRAMKFLEEGESKPAAKAAPKAAPKPAAKVEAPKAETGADKLRSSLGIGKFSAPKMIRGEKNTGINLKDALSGPVSESPRMKAAKRAQAMDASNYSMKKGGSVSSASSRGDGCAVRGKTKGRMV
jgi:hypothetical protein